MAVGVCKEEPPAPTRGKGPRTSPRSHGEQLHGGVATVAVAGAESCILGTGLGSNRLCSSDLRLSSFFSSSPCFPHLLVFSSSSWPSCPSPLVIIISSWLPPFLVFSSSCPSSRHRLLFLAAFSCLLFFLSSRHHLVFLAAFSSCFLLIFLFFSATFCSPLFSFSSPHLR